MTSGRRLGLLLASLDSLSLLLAFNLIGWMRGFLDPTAPIILPLVIPIVLLGLALYLIDGYRPRTDMLSLDYASTHTIALIVAMLTTLLITFVLIPIDLPLRPSRMAIALSFAVVTVVSISYRRWLYTFRASRHQHRALVFLGDEDSHETFDAECNRIGMKQTIIHANAGSPESLDKVISQMSSGQLAVEAVILRESFNRISPEASQKLVDLYFGGIPTYTLELFHQVYWRKIPLYRINQTWLFQEGFRVAREPVFERIKRLSDICFSLVGLTIAAPVLFVAALAIWIDDRGPIFFRQARIGCQRKPFTLFKLRTMRTTTNGDRYTREGDSRITRIGKFLRASRIDEFPQLLNVLRGEMSLIGPRAEWDLLVHDYETKIPCYHFRHLVRPGITGWAQVNYPYGANLDDTLRKLEYDLYYIRYFSFRLDASIVLKTVHVMLFGKGR